MALEVGRLVARIDLEGTFEEKLAKARSGMEQAARAASDLDAKLSNLGKGAKFDFPTAPKSKMDDASKSASNLGDSVKKATDAGKKLDVSNTAESKLIKLNSTTRDYGVSLKSASESGKSLNVSDQPKQKLAETASVADQVDSKFKGLGITMKGLAATAGGAAGLGAVLTKGWDRITAIDTAQGKLRGLGHEAQGVSTIMDSALDSVTGTSYGLGDAATIAANAVAAGIQPGKDLTKYLTMTADASAIAGVSLGEMGRILNQVQTGQSAYAGDLSQLADRGIPIYQWIADEAGIAASEVKKLASTGQISSEMLFSAIQNNIGGAAQELGGTLTGSLANVGAAFGRLGASAIDPFREDIMSAAEGAQKFAGTLSSVVGPAASVAATGLSAVASVVGAIPAPITGATAALFALQQTGLGPRMAGAASTAVGALRSFGDTVALSASYAGEGVRRNGLFATSLHGIKGAGAAARSGLSSVVDMLGGPWMIGIAAAGVTIGAMVDSANRAREANQALADAASAGAAAQTELGDALLRSNGLMDEQAVAASEKLIDTIVEGTRKAAESATGAFSIVDGPMHRMRNNYDALAGAVDNYADTANQGLIAANMSRLEYQALEDALSETGFTLEDVNSIVADGGARWDMLRGALANTGSAGEAMTGKLETGQVAIEGIVNAATEAEIASTLLSDAFRVMADESSTAEEKTNALKAALDALAGDTLTADQATGQFYETLSKLDGQIDKLSDGTGGFTRELEGGGLAFDMTSDKGRNLHATLLEMRDAIATVRDTGAPMSEVMAENEKRMQALATETGLTTQQLWELGERMGFIPDVIETVVSVDGAGAVAGELAIVSQSLKDVEQGAEVEVKNVTDEALLYLQEVGWAAERIPGTPNIRVTAQTSEAQAQLQGTITMAANLAAADPNVNVDSNADFVTIALGLTKDAVDQLPDGHVEITDTTDENMARLEALGIETRKDKSGRVIINDADVDRARQRVTDLNNIRTESRHTVIIGTVNRGGNDASTAGITVGQHYADGGIRGSLPDQATIASPKGPRGIVQWAEPETGGEAFIPLAPAKRGRSERILSQVADKFGYKLAAFSDGGIMASGLIDLAKGVEGKPYVWGGVQYGDCSGAVSSLANYVSGRAPFGSRFATGNQRQALRERGFINGRGGPGDLRIGWYNGGPYGGHTSATLPNGVNFEMGGARGNGQYGGQAVGADWSQYTDHAYFPMSRFADIDAAVTGDAMSAIGARLGTGNPSMPNDPGSPSASGIDLTVSGAATGSGTPVFVTNWPGGASTGGGDIKASITGDTAGNGFIEGASPAGMIANAMGRGDLVKVEKFADGGFHGLENHSAHIAPQGSMRIFGEPETGGEAYIPLASHKRARSTAILAETARRFGYSLGAGVNLAGSVLTGNGLDTGWGGPGLGDLGIDTGAFKDAVQPSINADAERLGAEIAAAATRFLVDAQQGVDKAMRATDDQQRQLRQNYARAMI
ncbi:MULTISPECIES: tape measure protein [unclassified Dietzia]|uniref:tape measure protein n=1 Tax=unclassified Dietzia TaxID=2617939 RepID=UPI001316BFEB|nr:MULTISPECIES: tape measure protein [unclassified Dietzia]QGW24263.1 hypothetical protein GJR88_01891 [Dietzia sp. DQ12-45-1b]